MPRIFSDSVQESIDKIADALSDAPPNAKKRAKRAAVHIEEAFEKCRKEGPGDPAVALGVAFAVFHLAQRLTEETQHGDAPAQPLIHLLS